MSLVHWLQYCARLIPAMRISLSVVLLVICSGESFPSQGLISRDEEIGLEQTTELIEKFKLVTNNMFINNGHYIDMTTGSVTKNTKNEQFNEEDDKTISQQLAEGSYGLIHDEIFKTNPKRPGIISYSINPEFPNDNSINLGGIPPEDVWLSDHYLLVISKV